jgi:hypothetical protein
MCNGGPNPAGYQPRVAKTLRPCAHAISAGSRSRSPSRTPSETTTFRGGAITARHYDTLFLRARQMPPWATRNSGVVPCPAPIGRHGDRPHGWLPGRPGVRRPRSADRHWSHPLHRTPAGGRRDCRNDRRKPPARRSARCSVWPTLAPPSQPLWCSPRATRTASPTGILRMLSRLAGVAVMGRSGTPRHRRIGASPARRERARDPAFAHTSFWAGSSPHAGSFLAQNRSYEVIASASILPRKKCRP